MLCTRVTSIASALPIGGRIEGSLRASIVLPVPGAPENSRLWPPAAATAIASSGIRWPRTSLRSGPDGPPSLGAGTGTAGTARPVTASTAARSPRTPITRMPSINDASRAWDSGTTRAGIRCRRVPSATASVPAAERNEPSSESSP